MTATDDNNCQGNRSYTLTIDCPTITVSPTSLPNGRVNGAYSELLAASGGNSPYSFAVTAGSLPAGLSLSSSGSLFGTPTAAGSFTFTVTATDIQSCPGTRMYVLAITLALNPATLPNGTVGSSYSQTINATGGTAPYSFALSSGSLPPGLTLSTSGAISGAPTTVGTFTFVATATDAVGNTGDQSYTITIDCPAISINPTSLPSGIVGAAYSQSVSGAGGTAPYSFALSSGALPNGITLSSSGLLSGTPTTVGGFAFAITATDVQGCTKSQSYSITINCPTISLSPSTPPHGTVGTSYSETISASGGTAPYAFVVTSGSLPPGLSLSSSGILSGTPVAVGISTFTITATDAQGCTGSKSYTLTINCPAITVSPSTLPNGTVAVAYSQTISASGGTAPYSFAVSSDLLPTGLSLSASGVLSGTPTVIGSYTFTITVTDAQGCTGNRGYIITINCPAISLNPASLPNGTVGASYNQTVSATGGTASYSFSVSSGALPVGLTLSSGGVLSGIPTTVGAYSFTITATDAQGCTGNRSYSVTIDCPTITISPSSLPDGVAGSAYNKTISGSGGTAPYSFIVSSGTLPSGLSLSAGGVLSGTPIEPGSFSFVITATDAQGCTGTRNYTLTINCPAILLNPSSLLNGTVGSAYSETISGAGGSAPYTFALTNGTLPNGLSLDASGALSGTPTVSGVFSFTVTGTDAHGCSGNRNYTLTINCPSVTLSSLPNGTVGSAYSQTISATNGTPPFTFSVTSGTVPTGLSLSSSGVLSGTPTVAGSFTFTVTGTDAHDCTGSQSYTLTMSCPTITLSSLPNGTVGSAYNQTIFASGGTASYSFVKTAGTLPAGLSLSSSGVLSGTSTAAGSYAFTVQATDLHGCSGSQSYALTMSCPSITISPNSLPNGIVSIPYNQTISASGGITPYTFTVTSGSLPNGLTLSSSGILSGAPALNGVYSFSITATDNYTCTETQAYTVNVNNCPTIALAPNTLPNGLQGTPYSQTITASGGASPYSFAVTSGVLPSGFSLSSGGVLSGTSSASGSFTFTIRATDNIGCTGSQSYTLTICATITLSSLTDGIVGTVYSQTITASGGTAPYSFVKASGTLPSGLSLSSSGVLSGTPTTPGSFTFAIEATDVNGCNGTQSYTVTMNCPAITLAPSTLPNGTGGSSYSQTIVASGGTSPYAFTLSAGSLPTGLSLTSGGLISGTPTPVGSYSFTITATDLQGCTGAKSYTVAINCPTINVSPATLPNGTVGMSYSQTVNASGGTSPYSFAVTGGTISSGLTLSSLGVLSGVPISAGTFTFTITATDAQGCTGSQSYEVSMSCPTITISPSSLPGGIVGTSYNQTLSASGGTTPYTFAMTSGTIPLGLTLSSGGVLSGTPSTIGSYTFTVTATDNHGCTGNQNYSITINCPVLTLSPSTLPNGTVGSAYSQNLSAAGGTTPYSFTVSSGSLPPGLSLSAAGELSGTPTTVGSSVFTITGTDAQGCTGSHSYTISISCPAISLNPPSLPNSTVGAPYNQTVTAAGGVSPYSFAVTSGTLPGGLTLSLAGVISGTPDASGTFTFTISATDGQGCIGTKSYSLTSNCPTVIISPSTLPNSTVGATYSQTLIGNGGTPPYGFAVTQNILPPGLSLSSAGLISGTPTSGGTYPFTVTTTDVHGCSGSQSFTIFISVIPVFSVSPTNVFFGNITMNSTKQDSVAVTNTGTGTLTINSVSSNDGQFVVSPISGTIPPAGNKKFYIAFTPGTSGPKTGIITFTHNAAGSPSTVNVNGTGVIPGFLIKQTLAFGNVVVGSSKKDSVTITNPGNITLNVFSAISDNAHFSVEPNGGSILPLNSKKFCVIFHPGSTGFKTGNIVFLHDAFGSPDSIAVNGTGVAPIFSIAPASLAFGSVPINSSQSETLMVTNSGTSALTIRLLQSTNPRFTILPGSGSIAPSGLRKFYVTYTPTTLGSDTGHIIFTHDAQDSLASIPVGGTGTTKVTLLKLKDSDGDVNTMFDQVPMRWRLALYRTSVSPANLVAEADTNDLSVTLSQEGIYIACESDGGPGWIRINGNQSRYDTLSLGTLSTIVDTFINFRKNTIVVSKFEDTDGNFYTTADRVPKNWYLEIRQNSVSGPVIASSNSTSVTATGLGDGVYYVIEADSSGWVNLGYLVNNVLTAGTSRVVIITLTNGQSASVDFINAPPVYSQTFRSFTPDGVAEKKAIKKKPTASRFCALFINNTGTAVNGLTIAIKASSSIAVVRTIESSRPFPNASSFDGRVWNFGGASVNTGDTVIICGVGNKPKPVSIDHWNWIINGVPQVSQRSFTPSNQQLLLPMPNFANLRDEVFIQGGFGSEGMVLGIAKPESLKHYGWVRIRKSKDLLRSLVDRSGYHNKPPHGFDFFTGGKPLLREQKTLSPTKHNNQLFADMAALRFGIVVSAMGKTPPGFGELIYDDSSGNSLNGMMVKQIAHYGDSLLMGYYQGTTHTFASSVEYLNLDATIQNINSAFSGPIDTSGFAFKLVLKGTRRLIDVLYLHANPNVVPERISPTAVEILEETPLQYQLFQNYPNPFNPTTTIAFDLVSPSIVTLKVYNVLGQEVAALLEQVSLEDGSHEVEFNAQHLATGVYFYRITAQRIAEEDESGDSQTEEFVSVKKMVLVK
ncbi:MAG: putative Ig domain-containing protein [Ignavibacteriales bacterium]|nr:putative Ig domain-containing protein [Ignavibacteriales bacterium]